jgi:hypothetical protein
MFPHPDRQRQATPRPEAVKGSGFALAVPPLTALAGSECGATCRSGWGGQNQDVNLHSNQPGWLSFRSLEWLINRPLQTVWLIKVWLLYFTTTPPNEPHV